MDDFLSTQQAAELLSLHRTTVLRLVEAGEIEARVYRYGSRPTIRIPRSAVEAFVARYAGPPKEELGAETPRG
jgi:excisionase family DNA binding protein